MKPYNIPIRLPEHKSDHNDRVYLSRASDYMPPIPSYESMKELFEKNKRWKATPLHAFISSVLKP